MIEFYMCTRNLRIKNIWFINPLYWNLHILLLRIHQKLHDAELPVLRAKLTRNWCSKPATWLKLIVLSVPEPLLVSQQTRKFRYISSNQVLLQQKKIRYLFKSVVPVQNNPSQNQWYTLVSSLHIKIQIHSIWLKGIYECKPKRVD